MAQVIFHGLQVVEVGVQVRVHQNRGVPPKKRCGNTNGSSSCAKDDHTRGLAVGTFSTRRGWPDRVLSTVPEELPKRDVAVYMDRALARSRTSHVETSIQVEICSVVG